MATDSTISLEEKQAILTSLRSGAGGKTHDRILRRKEAAERLGICPKTLDNWSLRGTIHPIRIKGSERAVGFRQSDVDAIIAGKRAEATESAV